MPNGMTVREIQTLNAIRMLVIDGKFTTAKQRAVKWINANEARRGLRHAFARTIPFLNSQLPEKFLSPLDPSGADV